MVKFRQARVGSKGVADTADYLSHIQSLSLPF